MENFWGLILSLFLILTAEAGPIMGLEISPFAEYEYTTGSQDYYSHTLSGGLHLKLRDHLTPSAAFTWITDSDYSWIQSETLRCRKGFGSDMEWMAGLVFSQGQTRSTNAGANSTALELELKRTPTKNLDVSAKYSFLSGSITTDVNRQVIVNQGRRTTIGATQVNLTSNYTEHTLSGAAGYELNRGLKGFYGLGRLGVSFISDQSNTYFESMEFSYPFFRRFYSGVSYTLTQTSPGPNSSYFSIFASKTF